VLVRLWTRLLTFHSRDELLILEGDHDVVLFVFSFIHMQLFKQLQVFLRLAEIGK
jgi:hypothetical protein